MKWKTNPFTKALKAEFFVYLHGFCDGAVVEKVIGAPVILSVDIFRKSRFFRRFHPKLLNHPKYDKIASTWLKEFIEKDYAPK